MLKSCALCNIAFTPTFRQQGGGNQKYCSRKCRYKSYYLEHPEQRKASILAYESKEETKAKQRVRGRNWRLKTQYNWTHEDFLKELERQNYSCYGCLEKIDEKTAKIDHKHGEDKPRGLLCDLCNRGIGFLKENPATMRRLTAYLDRDRTKISIYLAGSLKNKRIPYIGNRLRKEGYDVMDEWFTPGELADVNWQKYEKLRGRTYTEALRGRSATNIFLFDRAYLDLADIVVVAMPAGKSAMIELGYAKGRNKDVYLLLDGLDLDHYEIMPNLVDHVVLTVDSLIKKLKEKYSPL